MKNIYIAVFLLSGGLCYCGEDSVIVNLYSRYDSILPRVEYKFAGFEDKIWVDSLTYFSSYDSVKNFVKNKNAKGPSPLERINFYDSTFILVTYRGVDCHSGFDIKMLNDEANKEYKFIVKVIYGGCRAGGKSYTYWFLMPRLPEGYKITYHRYYIDRMR